MHLWSWSLSLPDYQYPCSFILCYFLILSILYPVNISYSYSYAIIVFDIICIIAVILVSL